MAYTAVPTVATGDLWTAANQNTYLKDNMAAVWPYTTAGDLAYASAANTLARLGIGSNGQVLKLASGVPSWGSGIGVYFATQTANYTITSSYGTVTGVSASVTTTIDGTDIYVIVSGEENLASDANNALFKIVSDSVDGTVFVIRNASGATTWKPFTYLNKFTIATAGTFDVEFKCQRDAGGGTILKTSMMVFVV